MATNQTDDDSVRSAPFPTRGIVDSERPSMASMASMASLASSFAKAETGSNRLHGEKSTKGEAIVQMRSKDLVVAPELRKAGITSTRRSLMLSTELPRPPTSHLDPFLHGNCKENKKNRPDNQRSVVRLSGSDRTCLHTPVMQRPALCLLAAFSGRCTPRHSPRSGPVRKTAAGFLTRLFA